MSGDILIGGLSLGAPPEICNQCRGLTMMTPLEKTEALFFELTRGYGHGYDKEMRAATKLLLVALDKIKQYGGSHWQGTVYEYIHILANDPERFSKILEAQRGATRGRGGRPTH